MSSQANLLQQGWNQHQAGDLEAAERIYRGVISVAPQNADAWVYLGIVLFDRRQFAESIDAYRRAIRFRSEYPIAWNNLGNSLRMAGHLEEAEACFIEALRQKPDYLSALKNRGTLWIWAGEIERGMQWYQRGIEIDPDNAELHRNLGVIYLLLGDYDRGWTEYRWRWRMPGLFRPRVDVPIWQGESLAGKTILLYPEQGLGDAIHFVRVCRTLADSGGRVILQCSARLIPLFSSTIQTLGVSGLIADGSAPPVTDFHASLVEAVDVIYQRTGKIDHRTDLVQPSNGYLHVSDELVGYWKRWLDSKTTKRRIGINWQGNPEHHADVYRSVPLSILEPLAQHPETTLVSLQFGDGREQLDDCPFGETVLRLPDHTDATEGAFTDTTAILANLDHVITTDTSIAHLAGATGTEVTVILGKVPDWRWLMQGDTTPWYPTMRLARQSELGRWDDVIASL